jgi:hypothetical protein
MQFIDEFLKEESSIIDENDTMMDLVVDFNVDHEI